MQLLGIDDVAKRLNVCVRQVHYLRRTGGFPKPVRTGERGIGFFEDEIREWLEARRLPY